VFTDIEGVEGSRDNDRITGDANNNRLDGRGGSDTLDGGAGLDWAEYNQATLGIIVNLAEGRAQDDGQAASDEGPDSRVDADVLISIENVQGGVAGDRITGDSGPNVIEGGPGNDTLFGAAGPRSIGLEFQAVLGGSAGHTEPFGGEC
jgi:Ca2+-binding RTX toxin-like protein